MELRKLSIDESKALLASPEGPAWRIAAVTAPQCDKGELKDLRRQRNKSEIKVCLKKQADCSKAMKFAMKNKINASCSALYGLTTVLLSTKAGSR